jgi:hypothetical protein
VEESKKIDGDLACPADKQGANNSLRLNIYINT